VTLLGLDVGTTGARGLAIDAEGRVVASASEDYPMATPHPGWTEQDPEDWWRASKKVLARVASQVRDAPVALGLSGQMHGSVFLDEHDRVIRPALLWNDQRTAAQCDEITRAVGVERLIDITGNPAITGFQAPKILWLRDMEPRNYERVRHVLLPKDYIRLRLTGERATDVSDASGTLLLDLRRRSWSDEILGKLELDRAWLPSLHEGPDLTGHVTSTEAGLPAGLPVAAGGGDNAAAAVGTGVVREGVLSCSIGTSGVVFAHTDQPRIEPHGRLHAFCHAVPGAYHLMGVTLAAGGSLRWWRDVLGGDADYDMLSRGAGDVAPGSEGLLFLPYLSGDRSPHLDPDARGAFFGLTLRHTRGHLTRAVMEGVAFSLKDSLDLMAALRVPVDEIRATGGGARSALWRSILADVFDHPIHRTTVEEGPAFGAALLAGVTAGVYRDVDEATSHIALERDVQRPDPHRSKRYAELQGVYDKLYSATRAAMHELGNSSPP
jgi:xylulokinase